MTPNIYEIFDEFTSCSSNAERISCLQKHQKPYFLQFLKNAFDPLIQYYVKEFPKDYIEPDTVPGIRYAGIESEIKRSYLFQKGNATADILTEDKRNQLLIQLIESFEPREAEYFVKMLKKELNVPFLTLNLVKEAFPGLISEH